MSVYRKAWMMHLLPGREDDYDAAHAAIWPELREQMGSSGILCFYLYRHGTTVFAFQERDRPFDTAVSPPSDVTRRWWRHMAPLMQTHGELDQPVHTPLQEIFAMHRTEESES